jgi:hypothetical protein
MSRFAVLVALTTSHDKQKPTCLAYQYMPTNCSKECWGREMVGRLLGMEMCDRVQIDMLCRVSLEEI